MKQMLQYLKAYKKESIIAPLFKMLEASFELLVRLLWQTSSMSVSRMATSRISGECAR